MYLSSDRNLVDGDEVVRSSSFPTCCHDGGHGCRSAVLRGDHHWDVVLWSRWSELGGVARGVVNVVRGRRGQSSAVSIRMHACALVDSYLYSCMHVDPYKHMQAAYLDYFNQLRMVSVDRRLDFLVC